MTKQTALSLANEKREPGIEEFQKMLNNHPRKDQIKVNKMANGAKYIPVGSIESLLDEHYSGLWSVENFRWEVIANEIVGSLDLRVFHPVMKHWITRTGAGSVMIQVGSGKAATVENKIKNTLVKDFPHLKSECLKNASKSLGSVFGRNLNRDTDDTYTPITEQWETLTTGQAQALDLLSSSTLTAKQVQETEAKIRRANTELLAQIITYLENNQQL